MVDQPKVFSLYFQPGPLSEILTIANLRHAAIRVWTSTEPEFRLNWMKLCSSDNQTPRCHKFNDWVIQWYKKVINLFISTSPFLWCAPWSKHCPCHCHFNFSSILNLGLNFCILPSSSTNNGSNKMLIGEPFKERTHQRTYHGQWHINKTLTYQIDLMIFEEIWSSFIRLSYNKKLQQITNQKSCLIRKKCIPLTRISGSKPCPCTNQWWRASTEHLQSTFLNRAWS